jgi:hypothetical protein
MLQKNNAKKYILFEILFVSLALFFIELLAFFWKSQILGEGIQGENLWFFEIDFMVKYHKAR